MSQTPSYGINSNNISVSRGVKHQQQHITQSQTRVPNIDMLSYNNSNNNNSNNGNITVVAESGGNTFTVANSTTMDQTTSITNVNTNTGAIPKEKLGKNSKQQQPRKPPPTIETFWPTILQEVQNAVIDSKHQSLPLARIKKIMKLDENAKMIAAEAPTLFAKACEFFIQELTMRAWIHTDESKRRTLQRSDIAQAIANYDQFDFLIDIVPREDIKPPNHRRHHNDSASTANNTTTSAANSPASSNSTMTTTISNVVTGEILNVAGLPVENVPTAAIATAQPTTATIASNLTQAQPTQMLTAAAATTATPPTPQLQIIQQTAHPQQHLQYFITLPGQQTGQAQLVHQLQLQHQQQQHLNNGLTAGTPLTAASLNLVAQQPQQIILTAANPTTAQTANVVQHQQQTALLQNIAQQQQQAQQQQHPPQQQQVQLLQQVMLTPNGELTNMPIAINANQLNLLRLQMQHQQQQQQQQQQHHQQQVIIPTHLLTAQQLLQLQAQAQQSHGQTNNTSTATAHIVHHQPPQTPQQQHQQQQHQQHQQQQTQLHPQTATTTNNIYINSNTIATNPVTAATAGTSMVSTDRNMGSTFRNNC